MVDTVIHERHVSFYRDTKPLFGFSSRAAYALGMNKPHYPVPAIPETTIITNTHVMVARKHIRFNNGYLTKYYWRNGHIN